LRDGRFGNTSMQARHIFPDRIIQPQLAALAELHDAGRRKTLRMRRDPKAVARRQLLAGVEIGATESMFEDDLAAMADGNHAAGLLRCPHLKFEPVADVVHRVLQPRLHRRTKLSGEGNDL
jgi:hypothetical protein